MKSLHLKSQPCPRNKRCCKYRRQKVRSKGAILIVFWTAMFSVFYNMINPVMIMELSMDLSIVSHKKLIQYTLGRCLYMFFPIAGWIADTWFGRYRVIMAGVYISLASALLVVMTIAVSYTLPPGTIKDFFVILTHLPVDVGYSCFFANIIQFATDQMIEIGASGEELSALIHWEYWAISLGFFMQTILFTSIDISEVALYIVLATISLACLFGLILSHHCFREWLTTTPMIANILKNVYSILNYARKTKYPRKRSALTYLDEEHPSRIDYGKDKFGGPFTEEEVEDVKTVLRMIPLFICMLANGMSFQHLLFFKKHMKGNKNNILLLDLLYSTIVVLIPPPYQLILYPLFYNTIPTMLQRAGIGTLLTFFSVVLYFAMDTTGHLMNPNVGCMFQNTSQLPVSVEWLHIPMMLNDIAICILEMSFLEFVIAQTPAKMKGLMVGLWWIVRGIGSTIGICFHFFFQYIPHVSPSCGFYFFLTTLVILLLVFIIFLQVSKWYKLRQREITVNIHAIAEEHWERYMDQKEEYERLWGSNDNINCSYGSTNIFATK